MQHDINKLYKILGLKEIKIKKENQSTGKFILTKTDNNFLKEHYKRDIDIYKSIY